MYHVIQKRNVALEEFKKVAGKYVCKYKCEEGIKQLSKTIECCDKALEVLK